MRIVSQLLLTFVFNAFWQIAVVTAVAACCAWLLRGTAAWCRHAVWVAALILAVSLPLVSSLRVTRALVSEEGAVQASADTLSGPVGTLQHERGEALSKSTVSPNTRPITRRFSISPIRVKNRLALALVAIYTLFLSYRGVKLFRAWRRTRLIRGSIYPIDLPGPVKAIIERCQDAVGITRVQVVCSASVPVPITAGVFNPLIILPLQLVAEGDEEILSAAVGHELMHVARHDYILNLVYELISLPVSFHPATALLRRRIKQTREICCDELVARKLLKPEVYARSLVRLIGSVSLARQLPANTTIGIAEADILEVRIMSLLQNSSLSTRRKTLSLTAAFLLLLTPCLAAASFALDLDIERDRDIGTNPQQEGNKRNREMMRAREELKLKEQQLEELVRKTPNMRGAQVEEVRRMERDLEEAATRLREQESEHQLERKDRLQEAQEMLAEFERQRPEREAMVRGLRDRLAQIQTQYPNRDLIGAESEALRRMLQDLEHLQEQQAQEKAESADRRKRKERNPDQGEEPEQEEREAHEKRGESAEDMAEFYKRMRKEDHESEDVEMDRVQADLTKLATVSMDRAIRVATSRYPGKVLSCRLERASARQASYHLVIINAEGGKSTVRHVWVNAGDGKISKTEQEY